MMPITITNLYDDLSNSLQSLRSDSSRVGNSRKIVDAAIEDGKTYYGINSGFGALAQKRISKDDLETLQRNLILSHAVGVGAPVPKTVSSLMLQMKIHSLGQGYSGISSDTFHQLLKFDEHKLVPVVPSKGSVGASGDLAPLAHLSLPLIGQGEFWSKNDRSPIPAGVALAENGIEPIVLHPKDGLALINGTQFMAAYGAFVLHRTHRLVKLADILSAMSLEALQGSLKPFDKRIHDIRPHRGQVQVAENIRQLLEGSEILESHRDCGKVQDPYSLRCIPQVHGACRDALDYARKTVEIEINSVTDNPLVFDDGDILSGGNFHGEPLAISLDTAAIALSEIAGISERRTFLLLEGEDGLPKLLMQNTGINSGFMIPQYTAAALVSENKVLSHPASVDSIPTCLGQEDHVSMGSISAVKLYQVLENVEHVLAVELITATQALDYRLPLKPGRGVYQAHEFIRSKIPHRESDGMFHDDLNLSVTILRNNDFLNSLENQLGMLR